jgi:hypothetical protein
MAKLGCPRPVICPAGGCVSGSASPSRMLTSTFAAWRRSAASWATEGSPACWPRPPATPTWPSRSPCSTSWTQTTPTALETSELVSAQPSDPGKPRKACGADSRRSDVAPNRTGYAVAERLPIAVTPTGTVMTQRRPPASGRNLPRSSQGATNANGPESGIQSSGRRRRLKSPQPRAVGRVGVSLSSRV